MSNQIQVGSVVRLKSGGPKMTVSKIHVWQGRNEAQCDWFEGTKATYGSFPLTSLEVVEEANPNANVIPPPRVGTWS